MYLGWSLFGFIIRKNHDKDYKLEIVYLSMVFSSGSLSLDRFLETGFPTNEVTMIYGGPASGKTTIAFQAALAMAKKGGKVIFIDVEGTFDLQRIKQMDPHCASYLDRIIVFTPKNFEEQEKAIIGLPMNADLIVVDSLSKYYRAELKERGSGVNEKLILMLRKLHKFVDREIPVIVTNQVYSKFNGGVEPVGGMMIKRWSQYLVRLQKEPRLFVIEKPLVRETAFGIDNSGIIL